MQKLQEYAVGKSPSGSKRSLNEKGVFLSVLGSSDKEKTEDLIFLKELIETGRVKSVIDKTYPLEKIVEAHRYVEKGHKKGNLIVKL